VSLAVNADASNSSIIAVGGSDSRVFVFDGAGRRKHVLKFTWDYVEHRHMGGNPDLNQPLALHLAGAHELLAIHNHGDLIRWDLRTGKPIKHIPPDCDLAEATTLVNRYKGPGDPPQTPTAEQRRGCGAAQSAAFSPDGSVVATGGIQGVRVRDTSSGAGLAMFVAADLPDDMLAFAADGTLTMVDLYGAVATWRRGEALQRRVPPRPSGPVDPVLARDGRTLYFHEGAHEHLWDLHARQPLALKLATGERVLAIAADGRRVVVRTTTGVELRAAATGVRSYHAPVATGVSVYAHFTPGAHVLLDIQAAQRSLIHVDPQGRGRPLAITADAHTLQLSDDGQLLAGLDYRGPAQVWRTDTGALAQTLTATRNLTLARDSSAVAWLEQPDPEQPKTRVHLRPITGAATDEQTLDLDGWPGTIALSHDGAELLILIQNGKLWRWRPAAGKPRLTEELGLYGIHRVDVSADGRLLLLGGYGHVDIRRYDEPLTPLATVHALVDGGWLAISRSGAVDGSPDAVASLVTRVTRNDQVQIFAGELGWDAAHVDGLVARALLGEDVAPPVPAR
jgi:WD40 repeat protein